MAADVTVCVNPKAGPAHRRDDARRADLKAGSGIPQRRHRAVNRAILQFNGSVAQCRALHLMRAAQNCLGARREDKGRAVKQTQCQRTRCTRVKTVARPELHACAERLVHADDDALHLTLYVSNCYRALGPAQPGTGDAHLGARLQAGVDFNVIQALEFWPTPWLIEITLADANQGVAGQDGDRHFTLHLGMAAQMCQ